MVLILCYNSLIEKGNLLKYKNYNEVTQMAKQKKSFSLNLDTIEYIESVSLEYEFNNISKALEYIVEEYRNTKVRKKAGRKGVSISQDELEELISCMTYKQIAEMYNVSIQTIQNKMKNYGITKESVLAKKQAELRAKHNKGE